VDYTIPTARSAKKVIIEVNRNMPRVFGDSCLHISEIDAIVENTVPLCEIPSRPSTELDHHTAIPAARIKGLCNPNHQLSLTA
jgi:itaconate CoA-transferase